MLRLKLLSKWGEYGKGSIVDFGESKGCPLIANGTAAEVDKNEKLVTIQTNSKAFIRLKLLKSWGNYGEGSVVDFGESKGRPLIANGTAVEVSKKEKIIKIKGNRKKRKKPPKVETATAEPVAETAEVTPQKTKKAEKTKGDK